MFVDQSVDAFVSAPKRLAVRRENEHICRDTGLHGSQRLHPVF